MAALRKFQELQEKNSAVRNQVWREKCYPDVDGQVQLIAHNMSVRFMQNGVLDELQEMRVVGGNNTTRAGATERPQTAPQALPAVPDAVKATASPVPEEEEEDKEAFMGRTRTSNKVKVAEVSLNVYAEHVKKSLKTRPKSAHQQRRQFLEVLTAPASAVEPRILERNMQQQNSIESRDPMTVYQFLQDHVSGALSFKLRSDQYGTKQELDLRKTIKKVDPVETRGMGVALVLDPSTVTQGHYVTLKLKYILNPKIVHTHTSSNVLNGNRQANAAHNFAQSQGLPPPFASTGATHLNRSISMPTKAAAATAYRETPVQSRSSSNLLNLANATLNNATGGHAGGESGGAGKMYNQKRPPKKFGVHAKAASTIVEVDYHINSARKFRYDLKLTTHPKAHTQPVVNDMPMFLPGWEGTLPIFIPAGHISCQVLVHKEGEEGGGSGSAGWSSRSSSRQTSRPTSAMRRAVSESDVLMGTGTSGKGVFQDLDDGELIKPKSTISLSGFAFPVESMYRALHVLKKAMDGDVRKKMSNLMVPGGQPALHVAALHGNEDACRSLVNNGADVNMKSGHNQLTALHEAVTGGSRSCVDVLLSCGANERVCDRDGNTPLHLACATGDVPCANLLMRSKEAGKVLAQTNKAGKLPFDVVCSNTVRQAVERGMRMHHLVVPSKTRKKPAGKI